MLANVWLNWSRTVAWFLPLLAEATAWFLPLLADATAIKAE
jgi:hypothetical protein